MKRSEAARYARWSAATACLLALLTVGVYLERKWVAHQEREKAPPPAPQDVHVEPHGVTFNHATGIAQSDQPVNLVFPHGQGQAVGVEYKSQEGAVQLLRDVNFLLTPANAVPTDKHTGAAVHEPVRVTAKSADFQRDSRVVHLRGLVE